MQLFRKMFGNRLEERFVFIITCVVALSIMVLGLVVGISLNLVHILFYTFTLDPTYIAFVIIISI